MSRSRGDVRGRLRQAALELYRDRGYDRTTTADIAMRAGFTERTFFRHFPDKREVLFAGEVGLREALTSAIAQAAETLEPMEVLLWAFESIEKVLVDNRPTAEIAREVIARTPALQERQLFKAATLTASLASALQQRGSEEKLATLAARTGMAAFHYAVSTWREDPLVGLGTHFERGLRALHKLSAIGSASSPPD